ncbi:tagaturonate reductase [Hymenobacter sp. RP-2-7]|uniref:Tagaturonate reductase n=1 Tax=Hymenobacter polaris TaxID=2682546 RepID=A0A7Y0AAQ0_9BACT|nr:tagaturonate reductase [Hymenobacter polaris]
MVRAGAASAAVRLPDPALLALPERVLQFGTGVLLRGLPDFLIDQANRQGIFNGRAVVVKSTSGGDVAAFERQGGLYTVCVRGIEDERPVHENVVCAAISRVLVARTQWAEVLRVAASPDLAVVVSNTTEVGLVLDADDDVRAQPPRSFPGKLLAVLLARYEALGGAAAPGLVIVPTELLSDNGTLLRGILAELAERQGMSPEFRAWLAEANTVCNSLVDRIVPGAPDAAARAALTQELGYDDELLLMSEAYRLWAIEGDEQVRRVLSFEQADAGVIVQPDITQFKELKLRLLNGTHSLGCGLAVLCGVPTVGEAMHDPLLLGYLQGLLLADLLPGIPYPVDEKVGQRFGLQVLDRFRNPAVEHRWLAITLNYSAKLRSRVLPDLLHYVARFGRVPHYVALGLAAYLLFMRGQREEGGTWYGEAQGQEYPINDEQAGYYAALWQRLPEPAALTAAALGHEALWDTDLTTVPGLADMVSSFLTQLLREGAAATLAAVLRGRVAA